MTQTDNPDPVVVNTPLTYTVNVTNSGPSPATNVTLIDTLPAGVTFVSASGATCDEVSGVVTCNLGSLANGALATITIVVTPTTTTPLTNVVTVSASESDPTPANNSDSEGTVVEAFASCDVSSFFYGGSAFLGIAPPAFAATADLNGDGALDIVTNAARARTRFRCSSRTCPVRNRW